MKYPLPPVEIPDPLPPQGVRIPVQGVDVGVRAVPLLSFGENSLDPLVRLLPEGLETRALAHRVRPYAEIEEARIPYNPFEFLVGHTVELWFRGDASSLYLHVAVAPWQIGLLTFLWRRGIPLNEAAQRLVWAAYGRA